MPKTLFVNYGENDIAPIGPGDKVIALVPSEAVVVRTVALPSGKIRHVDRITRYAIEDSLAEDVDQLHFDIQVDKTKLVARILAARRPELEDWLDWYREKGLVPYGVLPDFYALPEHDDGWALAMDDDRALIRTDKHQGFAIQADLLSDCIPNDHPADARNLYVTTKPLEGGLADAFRTAGWNVSESRNSIAEPVSARGMLTAEYRKEDGKKHRIWWAVAASLVLALGIEISSSFYRQQVFENEAMRLEASSSDILRAAVPSITRVVDPEAQAAQALAQLKQNEQRYEQGFSVMFHELSSALSSLPGYRITRLDYADEIMNVDLNSDTDSTTGQLNDALRARGFDVKRTHNRLQIKWKNDA